MFYEFISSGLSGFFGEMSYTCCVPLVDFVIRLSFFTFPEVWLWWVLGLFAKSENSIWDQYVVGEE